MFLGSKYFQKPRCFEAYRELLNKPFRWLINNIACFGEWLLTFFFWKAFFFWRPFNFEDILATVRHVTSFRLSRLFVFLCFPEVLLEFHRFLIFGCTSHRKVGLLLGWLGQSGAESQLPCAGRVSLVPQLHDAWLTPLGNFRGGLSKGAG